MHERVVSVDRRPGTTLVELIVVLAILAIGAGIAGIAFTRDMSPRTATSAGLLADARRRAIASGVAISMRLRAGSDSAPVVVLPDGSVIGDSLWHMDRLSGRPVHASR